ncbi:PEP-CTERM sorting domain-containing protein [Coraliomargarita parva]|uniref:PEP-CTERM sorting domain-containing protein n=1 Tax=Coraliomargarita parva TaxID=3014050 RepID=UPI0022B4FC1A|nr:PEP-CTERM sorting domain-containing protein [Coraliomargarita parva]
MKNNTHYLLTSFFSALLLNAVPSAHAAIVAGDTIVADFTNTTGAQTTLAATGEYWNNLELADNTNFSTLSYVIFSDMVRYTDGAATGVSFIQTGGGNSGMGGLDVLADDAAAIFPVTGPLPTSAQEDTFWGSNGSTYAFDGLNDSLLYNFSIQSWVSDDADRDALGWIINAGLASEQTIVVDPNDSPSVYTFSNIATDGSGRITLTSVSTSGTGAQHINAFELTAVIPEPGTFALITGMLSMVTLVWRRR